MFRYQITPSLVSYTVGQLALLQASGHDVSKLARIYADAVVNNCVALERSLALQIETTCNQLFYAAKKQTFIKG